MADQNIWYRLISLARSHAADDLRLSNNLLAISDALQELENSNELSNEQITIITDQLIQISIELTDKSKDMNFAITKLMGGI
tara:strand:+ start:2614 stop:2859 length:246 start_codon:yes stop_codon:yes gene_type:complete